MDEQKEKGKSNQDTNSMIKTTTESDKQLNVVSHNSFNALNLFDDKQLAQAEIFLKKIIGSEKCGIKSIQDGLSILMRAQDLQLPFSTCIEHIHVINGKTGVDVHIVKSLLSRAGVTWECVKDYTPLYQYTDGNNIYEEDKLPEYCVKCRNEEDAEKKTNDYTIGVYPLRYYTDLKGNVYNEFQVSPKCVKVINKAQALSVAKDGQFPIMRIPPQPVNYVTEYKFTRYFNVCGKLIKQVAIGHFSYIEAQVAGLFDKDTYKKYARILISHRAFMYGARDIASDLIMGCMETQELKFVENVDIQEAEFTEI